MRGGQPKIVLELRAADERRLRRVLQDGPANEIELARATCRCVCGFESWTARADLRRILRKFATKTKTLIRRSGARGSGLYEWGLM